MFAGLPGIGIGGIFYAILAVGMLLRALWRVVRKLSMKLADWKLVGLQLAMVGAMALVLTYEGDAIVWAYKEVQTISENLMAPMVEVPAANPVGPSLDAPSETLPAQQAVAPTQTEELRRFMPTLPYASFAILLSLFFVVQGLRLLNRRKLVVLKRGEAENPA